MQFFSKDQNQDLVKPQVCISTVLSEHIFFIVAFLKCHFINKTDNTVNERGKISHPK